MGWGFPIEPRCMVRLGIGGLRRMREVPGGTGGDQIALRVASESMPEPHERAAGVVGDALGGREREVRIGPDRGG
jgi:hypothetical protein